MPIIRKVVDVGSSKAVTLPKTWLEFFEKELGKPIEYVALEVNEELKISPYIPPENKVLAKPDRRRGLDS